MKHLILFLALIGFLNASNTKLEKVSLQLHWKYQFEFAGFIAAKEKGFYEDVGLDVELKEYQFGTDIVDEVLDGKSTYGVYNSSILVDYMKNKSIVLLSSYFKRSALVLLTKPYIKKPSDLIGKTIMANGEEDFDLNFRALFLEHNIDTSSIKLVPHTYNIKDFLDKNIDAMTAFISSQPYELDKLGLEYNVIDPSDYGSYNLQLELFTSKHEVSSHTRRTENFRDASKKGWEYALTHKKEIVEIIHKKYAKNLTKDFLNNEALEIQKLILPLTYEIGSIDKNFLKKQIKTLKSIYNIKSFRNIDNFIHYTDKSNHLNFTEDEIEFLLENKNISLCIHTKQFPYDDYIDSEHVGIMSDIFNIMQEDLNVNFKIIPSKDPQELIENVKQNRCQLLSIMPTKNDLFPNMIPSKPIIKSYFTIIGKLDKFFIENPVELKGKKFVVKNRVYKEYIKQMYPYIELEIIQNPDEMMKKVIKDEVYGAIVIDAKADFLIDRYGYGKLKINGFLAKDNRIYGSIGVLNTQQLLDSIIQKELNNISSEKIDSIIESWKLNRYSERKNYDSFIKLMSLLLIIVSLMIYYQRRLKKEVVEKTKDLVKMNESLEKVVDAKVQELIDKDEILTKQSKQAVMGEMINMIAHQWRQPLSTITLQISNLEIQRMMQQVSEEETAETLQKISDTILYLSETVDDFQTYFRTNKESTQIEIHELLQKAVNFSLPRVKGAKIEISIKKEKLIYVNIYINELVQVVLNMLNNAIDAFENLERDNKEISLYVEEEGEYIHINIEDNASGIEKEHLARLFEPYYSTKGKNGTGLGLYMCKMIVEKQFSGEISVESSSDGTTFSIKIKKSVK